MEKIVEKPSGKEPKRRRNGFWDKFECVCESMEFGMRAILGLVFVCIFSSLGWSVGSYVWSGLGVLLALIVAPVGFLVGFFWLEVKFLLRILINYFTGF